MGVPSCARKRCIDFRLPGTYGSAAGCVKVQPRYGNCHTFSLLAACFVHRLAIRIIPHRVMAAVPLSMMKQNHERNIITMKILLTAFEPFGGERINPAQAAVSQVADEIEGAQVVKLISVPVVFDKSIQTVTDAISREQPDATLCIGQAGGCYGLTVERVAINLNDSRIPDNEGNQPVDTPVAPDGAPAYFSTLPVKAMVKAIQAAGIPATLSNSAGTYVCNHLMYGVLHHAACHTPGMRSGFLHVPFLPEQAVGRSNTPSMSREDIIRGLEAAIAAIVKNGTDLSTPMGEIH